jgi:branched-chain amino acid transport system substrate-binding protein
MIRRRGVHRDEHESAFPLNSDLSRRAILKYSAGGLVAASGGMLLAACSSSSTNATSSVSSGTAPSSATTSSTLTAAEKQTLLSMAGPSNSKFYGKGVTWNIGGAFPFSGPGGYYGTIELDGLNLAAQHIAQIGGPTIKINVQNFGNSTGVSAQSAVDAMLDYHDDGIGLSVSGVQGAYGAVIPDAERYHIINIDSGAGVEPFGNKPYYWAMRNNYPESNVAVALKYAKAVTPALRSAIVIYYTGASYAPVLDGCVAATKAAGFTVTGTATLPEGTTDWSDAFTAIRAQNPDLIVLNIYGDDAAYFLKQFQTAGLTQPVYTFSFSEPQATAAGNGFNNIYVVQEDFVPDSPSNDWQTIFTKYYRQEFKDQPASPASPFNVSANYYNTGFVIWEIASRVLAQGGNINDGSQLQAALAADPKFPSIFGGSGSTPGSIEFDTVSHGLASVPLAVLKISNNVPTRLAVVDALGTAGAGPITMTSS